MATIGDRFANGGNAFNAVRHVAAVAVIVSHAFPIARGLGAAEPLDATGHTLGTWAVLVFFSLSGFLIAASVTRDPDPVRFATARAVRVLPALAAMLALTVLVIAPLLSTAPLARYCADWSVPVYFVGNLTFTLPSNALPGMFGANPLPDSVNGSLWSLQCEILCYALLYLAARGGVLRPRRCVVAVMACFLGQSVVNTAGLGLLAFVLPSFAVGAALFVCRDRIPVSGGIVAALLLACWLVRDTPIYVDMARVAVAYGTLWIGLAVPVRAAPRRGSADLSYGLYIYGFLVEQSIVALLPGIGVAMLLAIALPVTIGLAALSWFLIERPALTLSRRAERRGGASKTSAAPAALAAT